jgi:diguanylate cyclase
MTDRHGQDGNGHAAQNAAVLLKVAQTMAKLGVAAFPRNYELFYEALSGQNQALTRDVAALGCQPTQNRVEEIGVKYHLSGFAAIATDNIRADIARAISTLSHRLTTSIAKKEAFTALLCHFNDRLEADPVAGMSDFADDAGRLLDAVTAFEREERALAISMGETIAQLGGIGSDIEAVRKASTRDPVTGLANRIAFSAKLAALYDDGNAAGPAALALVTVEGLRGLGESHGAAIAERAVKKLAPVFRKSVKKNDFVARTGADEFAFVFHDVNTENAEAIVQRIRASVESVQIVLPNRTFTRETLSLSTGIAMALTASSGTDLLTQAELALAAVRATGKPGILVFSAAIGGRAKKTYSPHAA